MGNMSRAQQLLANVDILRIMDALVFGGFAFISFFMMLGSLSTRNQFRPADVDVLFPTPVEPRLVLIFRIFRDYLLTLFTPLLFIVIGYRPASAGLKSLKNISENPDAIAQMIRLSTGVWLLVALCWVCITYSASLFVNRSDLASDRNRAILAWSLGLLAIGVSSYVAVQFTHVHRWEDAVAIAESPILRTVFFTATLATWTVHGIVQSDPLPLAAGMIGLLGIIFGSIKLAASQAGWMYDQAAAKGFDNANARKLQQQGDTIGLITEQARRGKIKAGRSRWLARITVKGAPALLWKEAIVMLRSTWFLVLLFSVITIAITFVPLLAVDRGEDPMPPFVYLIFQGLGTFVSASALSQAGFIEMLRRVDVLKPLPFSFSTSIMFEVASKALPAILNSWLCMILALIIKPSLWQEALASAVAVPMVALLICGTTCLMTILFPDFEDHTQRGFRGLMNFVGIALVCLPTAVVFGTLLAFQVSPIISALISTALNIGIAAIIFPLTGNQYAQFNPSE
jgi:hypothetical protein